MGCHFTYEKADGEEICITLDDTASERSYWKFSMIGHVLGSRVPYSAMEGYVNNQWRMVTGPGIHLYESGYYIFRFADEDDMMRVINNSWFFNSRPLVLKPWHLHFVFEEKTLSVFLLGYKCLGWIWSFGAVRS